MRDKIRFKDLSGWLKLAFIYAMAQLGANIVMLLYFSIK